MRVQFNYREAGPARLLGEAELLFDDADGPPAGLRLMGFYLWRGTGEDIFVTFPSRAIGLGTVRRYFDYLRGEKDAVARFKAFLVDAFKADAAARKAGEPAKPPAGRRQHRTS